MERIAIVDIETTGFDNKKDLILEIGMVELVIESGETNILFDSIVREKGFGDDHKDSWIFNNSDLCFEDVRHAPKLKSKRAEIQELLDSYHVTAYNSTFDFGFLRAKKFKIANEIPCIMKTCTDIVRIPKTGVRGGYKWPKFQEAWDHFFPDTVYREKHRAVDDALHEAKILHEMYKMGRYPLRE